MAYRVEQRRRKSRTPDVAPADVAPADRSPVDVAPADRSPVDGGSAPGCLARAAPSTKRHAVTAAMGVAFVMAFPLGFTGVMYLDVAPECRLNNTSNAAIEACISSERGGLWWLPHVTVVLLVGLGLVVGVGMLSGLRHGAVGLLVGALNATVAVNVAVSRGLSYDEITSSWFVIAYLPTTIVMTVLTLRWVPPAAVDGDRVAARAWTSLVACAVASLAVSWLLGTHEAVLRWFGPVVVAATLGAVLVAASLQWSDRVVRSRRLASVLMPIGCGVALLLGLLAS